MCSGAAPELGGAEEVAGFGRKKSAGGKRGRVDWILKKQETKQRLKGFFLREELPRPLFAPDVIEYLLNQQIA